MDLQSLKKLLHDAKIRPGVANCPPFVPEASLMQVLSAENVLSVLREPVFGIEEHKWEDTARRIVREGRKAFAVLLEVGFEHHLSSFVEHELLDSVPAELSVLSAVLSETEARLFENIQSDYVVHTFSRGVWTRKIKSTTRLPYVNQQVIGEGGYSTVYRVSICSTHQEIVPEAHSVSITLVRKELRPRAQDGKAEADLLFLLGSVRHPNVVELLGAYVYDGITNLLFHPADFDLQYLLQANPRPDPFAEEFNFFAALGRLAAGLGHLHNFIDRSQQERLKPRRAYRGYHHDIKPQNILIRGSDFILADFGLASLKQVEDDSKSKTTWKVGTFDYGAPECRDFESFEPGMVGRAIDIWSLGCITAEVAIYISSGPSAITEFRNARLMEGPWGTVQCFHDGQRLSSKVVAFLQRIKDGGSARSLSELIQEVRRMLTSEPSQRPSAKQVETRLSRIAIESLFDLLLAIVETELKEAVEHSVEQNLYRALILIERHRLQAWAGALGLASDGQESTHASYVEQLGPTFYQTLKTAYDGLKCPPHFDMLKDRRDFFLNLLRQANDELCVSLPEDARVSIDSIFFILTTHQAMEQCEEQSNVLEETVSPSADSSAAAAMKYMSLKLGRPVGGKADLAAHRIETLLMAMDRDNFNEKDRRPVWHYTYGHHLSKPTIVEFIPYWAWKPNMPDSRSQEFEEIVEALYTQVSELISVLKKAAELPGFRVLDCLGAFHDPDRLRFGVVYGFPNTTNFPVRLNKLLRQPEGPGVVDDPGPAEKLGLARMLVACVQRFHTLEWIHKGISSLNVLFFPQAPNDWSTIDLSQPFVIGFDHSRKGGKGQYSKGPDQLSLSKEYQHPDYRKGLSRAKRSFDYYSLGLALLEIGFWVSIRIVCDNKYNPTYQSFNASQLRDEYLDMCNTKLGKVMGPRYQAATKACLECGSAGKSDLEEQLSFQESVVDVLNKCVW